MFVSHLQKHLWIAAALRRCMASLLFWSLMPTLIAVADDGADIVVMNALLKTIEATTVGAEVAGKIEMLDAVEGDSVSAGQLLGKIQDSAVEINVENARILMAIARKKEKSDIDVRLAQQTSKVADIELERAEAANARIPDTYPPKEIDRLRLVAASAQLEIERTRHEKELAQLDVLRAENEFRKASHLLSLHQIASPVDGVVVSLEHRVGEWVEPGTELLKIVKNDRLRIEGFLSADAAIQNLKNREASVSIFVGKNEKHLSGKVIFVSPDANPVNGNVRVFLEIENRGGQLRPGMRVKATIKNEPQ